MQQVLDVYAFCSREFVVGLFRLPTQPLLGGLRAVGALRHCFDTFEIQDCKRRQLPLPLTCCWASHAAHTASAQGRGSIT
jgi:hypothetical protein